VDTNVVYLGDNLAIMQDKIPDKSIDLVYLDPPFNSKHNYHTLHGSKNSVRIEAGVKVFNDSWEWNENSAQALKDIETGDDARLIEAINGFRMIIGESSMLAYLMMMAPRLVRIRAVLKETGSIYLHCDQHAGGYLRLLMDAIFGSENFLNCIVWCYGLGGSSPRYWPRKHDDILWYAKQAGQHYFEAVKTPASSQKMKGQMKKLPDYWNIPTINNMVRERLGFPTQKPEALLERIIISSSHKGDVILDPFCGSGTTLAVAARTGRKWIGIDISEKAVELAEKRLSF